MREVALESQQELEQLEAKLRQGRPHAVSGVCEHCPRDLAVGNKLFGAKQRRCVCMCLCCLCCGLVVLSAHNCPCIFLGRILVVWRRSSKSSQSKAASQPSSRPSSKPANQQTKQQPSSKPANQQTQQTQQPIQPGSRPWGLAIKNI